MLMGIFFLLLDYFLFFSIYKPKYVKKVKIRGLSIFVTIILIFQVSMVVGFLERRNFDQSPTYVKDKVKYEVEVSYYLENSENCNVSYSLHTIGFQDPSQISYQNTRLQYTEVVGKDFLINSYIDRNGNVLYLIEVNLTAHEKVVVRQIFEITRLNIIVNNLEDYESSSYRALDNDMDRYLAQEPEREVLNPELIRLSKSIVGNEDSPLIKAERIYEWIGDNIEYNKAYKGGGALNTYLEGKGTCGDYTDLMITLLRIQQIPARKVYGFFLDERWPKKSHEFEIVNATFRHSWAEYFVPGVGWVICEPTFGIDYTDYYASIDCSHFRTFTGEMYAPKRISEYVYTVINHELKLKDVKLPIYWYEVNSVYSIKVLETMNTDQLHEQMSFFLTIITLGSILNGAVFIISIIWDMIKKRKSKILPDFTKIIGELLDS